MKKRTASRIGGASGSENAGPGRDTRSEATAVAPESRTGCQAGDAQLENRPPVHWFTVLNCMLIA